MDIKKESNVPVKKARSKAAPVGQRKSVNIERIVNGYLVSSYNERTYKDTKKFAKTKVEAKNLASKML